MSESCSSSCSGSCGSCSSCGGCGEDKLAKKMALVARKIFVLSGKAEISFRHMITDEIIRYTVEGNTPTVVDIPVGYTHKITNIGDTEVICLFWSSEIFNPEKPDTYYVKVDK